MRRIENNTLLDSISIIYDSRIKLFKTNDLLLEIDAHLSEVATFFDTDNYVAAVLSVIFCQKLKGEEDSLRRIMNELCMKTFNHVCTKHRIDEFVAKGWIKSRSRAYSRKAAVELSKSVELAIEQKDKMLLRIERPANLSEALLYIRDYIFLCYDYLQRDAAVEVLEIAKNISGYEYIGKILDANDLSPNEKLILLWVSSELIYTGKEFDLFEVASKLIEDSFHFLHKRGGNLKQLI